MRHPEFDNHLLPATLDLLVPLCIQDLQARAGPGPADYAALQDLPSQLGRYGDVLLYGEGHRGQVGALVTRVATAIAVLAFCPGGITLFGRHWEVAPPEPERTEEIV